MGKSIHLGNVQNSEGIVQMYFQNSSSLMSQMQRSVLTLKKKAGPSDMRTLQVVKNKYINK